MKPDPLYREALRRVEEILDAAKKTGLSDPLAMTLATADRSGRPSARVVLLRGFDDRGFAFYTNSESPKGRDLSENPRAALCFYWDALHQQIRVEGTVAPLRKDESDRYWEARPRAHQISASASQQSSPLVSRAELEARIARLDEALAGKPIPRPAHWHGYRVAPTRIEIWSMRPSRLHERDLYELRDGRWVKELLQP